MAAFHSVSRDQFAEQATLFPDTWGTGLSTDPVNAKYRASLAYGMAKPNPALPNGGRLHLDIAKQLNRSNIPLQHLHDVSSMGVEVTPMSSKALPKGGKGSFQIMRIGDEVLSRTVGVADNVVAQSDRSAVHEFGHAYHHFLNNKFGKPQRWFKTGDKTEDNSITATKEGVADGYADKYGTLGEGYTKYLGTDRVPWLANQENAGSYSRNRENVRTTGVVPFVVPDRTATQQAPGQEDVGKKFKQGELF